MTERSIKRKAIGKRLRFEVFKRDRFACQYCGKKAPDVVLVIDHIDPVAKGGANDILNLVTACDACNGGKSDKPLTENAILERQRTQLEQLQARRDQLAMLVQWQKGLASLDTEAVSSIAEFWGELTGWFLTDTGKKKVKLLLTKFGVADVMESMREATSIYLRSAGDPPKSTQESVEKSFEYTERMCRSRKLMTEKPHMKDLFYIRGIVRRRFDRCIDWAAIKLLEQAHDRGVAVDDMRDIAMQSTSWSNWQDQMIELTEVQP